MAAGPRVCRSRCRRLIALVVLCYFCVTWLQDAFTQRAKWDSPKVTYIVQLPSESGQPKTGLPTYRSSQLVPRFRISTSRGAASRSSSTKCLVQCPPVQEWSMHEQFHSERLYRLCACPRGLHVSLLKSSSATCSMPEFISTQLRRCPTSTQIERGGTRHVSATLPLGEIDDFVRRRQQDILQPVFAVKNPTATDLLQDFAEASSDSWVALRETGILPINWCCKREYGPSQQQRFQELFC